MVFPVYKDHHWLIGTDRIFNHIHSYRRIAGSTNNLFVTSLISYVSHLAEEIFSVKVPAKHNTYSFYISYDTHCFMQS